MRCCSIRPPAAPSPSSGSSREWWDRLGIDRGEAELELRGEGQLVWDLDAGHFRSFDLEARVEVELEMGGSRGTLTLGASGLGNWSSEVLEDD